jgi:hypothetical protein
MGTREASTSCSIVCKARSASWRRLAGSRQNRYYFFSDVIGVTGKKATPRPEWEPWRGARGSKSAPAVGQHESFGFLTIETNAIVAPIHPKAMPVILTSPGEVDLWLEGKMLEALKLQRPLPDAALRIVAKGADSCWLSSRKTGRAAALRRRAYHQRERRPRRSSRLLRIALDFARICDRRRRGEHQSARAARAHLQIVAVGRALRLHADAAGQGRGDRSVGRRTDGEADHGASGAAGGLRCSRLSGDQHVSNAAGGAEHDERDNDATSDREDAACNSASVE